MLHTNGGVRRWARAPHVPLLENPSVASRVVGEYIKGSWTVGREYEGVSD